MAEPDSVSLVARLPKAWTEVRYCVYSYRSEPEWWEMVAHYSRLEPALDHADAINGREGCAAAVGWQTVSYGGVRLIEPKQQKASDTQTATQPKADGS